MPKQKLPDELQILVNTYGPYLNLEEAARCLKMNYQTMYGLVRAREISASRNGQNGAYKISALEIVKYASKWAV